LQNFLGTKQGLSQLDRERGGSEVISYPHPNHCRIRHQHPALFFMSSSFSLCEEERTMWRLPWSQQGTHDPPSIRTSPSGGCNPRPQTLTGSADGGCHGAGEARADHGGGAERRRLCGARQPGVGSLQRRASSPAREHDRV
jgi:hypothetical protein